MKCESVLPCRPCTDAFLDANPFLDRTPLLRDAFPFHALIPRQHILALYLLRAVLQPFSKAQMFDLYTHTAANVLLCTASLSKQRGAERVQIHRRRLIRRSKGNVFQPTASERPSAGGCDAHY